MKKSRVRQKGKRSRRIVRSFQQAIRRAGLSHDDVTHLAGITQWDFDEIFHGRRPPTLREAFRLAWVLGHSIEEMFNEWDDTKTTHDPDQAYLRNLVGTNRRRTIPAGGPEGE